MKRSKIRSKSFKDVQKTFKIVLRRSKNVQKVYFSVNGIVIEKNLKKNNLKWKKKFFLQFLLGVGFIFIFILGSKTKIFFLKYIIL